MIWALDLALLTGVSFALGLRDLYSGMVVFTLGILLEYQLRRTRLLIGSGEKKSSIGTNVRAVVASLLFVLFVAPLLISEDAVSAQASAPGMGWGLPVIILVGLLCGMLMVALVVERRSR